MRRPSDVVGEQVQAIRKSRGWTARELAERCQRLGATEITTSVIANLETGRRTPEGERRRDITVDELLVLADALDAAPIDLLVPAQAPDDELYAVAPDAVLQAGRVRRWITGEDVLTPPETFRDLTEIVRFMPDERAKRIMSRYGPGEGER